MQIVAPATSKTDLDEVRVMFREYAELVAEALCFQDYGRELAALPGDYAPPGGALLLARDAAGALGCVGLRRHDPVSGEMKRMYVRERGRGSGLGRRLAVAFIEEARQRGYQRILLDTLPKLTTAITLYRSLGFREVGPYLSCPTPGAICFELGLS